jgi:hypothetical protein
MQTTTARVARRCLHVHFESCILHYCCAELEIARLSTVYVKNPIIISSHV